MNNLLLKIKDFFSSLTSKKQKVEEISLKDFSDEEKEAYNQAIEDFKQGKVEQWNKFRKTNNIRIDLQNTIIQNLSLQNINLYDAMLQGITFENVSLNGADLGRANIDGSFFKNVNLSNSFGMEANFQRSNLFAADFEKSNFEKANFQEANLESAIFKEANFQKANLKFANLKGANLEGVNFRNANLENVDFQNKRDIHTVNFNDSNSIGIITNFYDAHFAYAHLQKARFTGVHLQGADLQYTNLKGANFFNSVLTGINMKGANMEWAFFKNAHLNHVNLEDVNLKRVNLNSANLDGANFTNADLYSAKLTHIDFITNPPKYLEESQLRCVDLSYSKLPKEKYKFDGIKRVEEISKNARPIFISLILACLYCWLTIGTTDDISLITNSSMSELPIIGTSLPILYFLIAAPIVLFGIYIYFHLYLLHLWRELASLPAIFPDCRSLDEVTYPWLLNKLVRNYVPLLKEKSFSMQSVQSFITYLLAWGLVPITILLFWYRCIAYHEMLLSGILLFLFGLSLFFCLFFLYEIKQIFNNKQKTIYWRKLQTYLKDKTTLFTLGRFISISLFATISLAYISYLSTLSMKDSFFKTYTSADFRNKDVSTKQADYTDKDKAVKGADLHGKNLNNLKGRKAFLVNANLEKADLNYVDLSNSDLRNAILKDTNLEGANLKNANLEGANLEGANLKNANLEGAILKSTNLKNAILTKADLKNANLENVILFFTELNFAYLERAIFQNANIFSTNFEGSNLPFANFKDAFFQATNFENTNIMFINFENVKNIELANLSKCLIDQNTYKKYFSNLYSFEKISKYDCKSDQYNICNNPIIYSQVSKENIGILKKKLKPLSQ